MRPNSLTLSAPRPPSFSTTFFAPRACRSDAICLGSTTGFRVTFAVPGTRKRGGMISSLTGHLETRRHAIAASTLHAISTLFYGLIDGVAESDFISPSFVTFLAGSGLCRLAFFRGDEVPAGDAAAELAVGHAGQLQEDADERALRRRAARVHEHAAPRKIRAPPGELLVARGDAAAHGLLPSPFHAGAFGS